MNRGKMLSADILTRLQKYDAAEAAQKNAAMENTKREQERFKNKAKRRVKEHEEVIAGSQECIQQIEESITRLEDVLSRVTHERYARFADMQVNLRRQEYRDKRPPAESFKDALQAALSGEQQCLNGIRNELLAREEEIKSRKEILGDLRVELSRDAATRRLKVEHELASLKPMVLVEMMDKEHANPSQDRGTQNSDPRGIINKGYENLANVDEYIIRSNEAIARSRQESRVVTKQVMTSLEKRCGDMTALKKSLEEHLADVDYAIDQAERGLGKYEKRLNPRSTDYVDKKAKVDAGKAVLLELQQTKADIVRDLRCKITALDIDNACRRVTPQIASEAKQGKAATVGGAAGSTPSSPSTTRNSASAPNLHNLTSGSNPSSNEVP